MVIKVSDCGGIRRGGAEECGGFMRAGLTCPLANVLDPLQVWRTTRLGFPAT